MSHVPKILSHSSMTKKHPKKAGLGFQLILLSSDDRLKLGTLSRRISKTSPKNLTDLAHVKVITAINCFKESDINCIEVQFCSDLEETSLGEEEELTMQKTWC